MKIRTVEDFQRGKVALVRSTPLAQDTGTRQMTS